MLALTSVSVPVRRWPSRDFFACFFDLLTKIVLVNCSRRDVFGDRGAIVRDDKGEEKKPDGMDDSPARGSITRGRGKWRHDSTRGRVYVTRRRSSPREKLSDRASTPG